MKNLEGGNTGVSFFTPGSPVRPWVFSLLVVLALVVRLPSILNFPQAFHTGRQYHNFLIARGFYYEREGSGAPEAEKAALVAARHYQEALEPPVLEWVTSRGYQWAGGEKTWIPRLLIALVWLLGTFFFYRLACEIASRDAALFATGFYLLYPYGVLISTSFQPDPVMTVLVLISLDFQWRYAKAPSLGRLLLAAFLSGLAVLVKPLALFSVLGVFVCMTLARVGFRQTLKKPDLYLFSAAALIPSLAYYVYRIFTGGFLRAQWEMSFVPKFLLTAHFWRAWLAKLGIVIEFSAAAAALFGVFVARKGLPRAMLIGLWAGYFTLGLLFTFQIHTHDYYQLSLIMAVPLSIAAFCDWLVRIAGEKFPAWRVVAMLLSLGLIGGAIYKTSVLHKVWRMEDFSSRVRAAEEIGGLTGHSAKTFFLSTASRYGKILCFYGKIAGLHWPDEDQLVLEGFQGRKREPAGVRFKEMSAILQPDYFIITDRRQYEQQKDLKEFLTGRYPVLKETGDYLIFDLRKGEVRADRH